jgi:hypothetical protein
VVGGVGAKIINGRFKDEAALEFAKSGLGRMFEEIDMLARSNRLGGETSPSKELRS